MTKSSTLLKYAVHKFQIRRKILSNFVVFLENLYFRRVSRSLCELFDAFFQGYVPSVNPHYDLTENTYQFDVYLRGNDKKCQKTVRSTTFFLSNHVTAAFIKTESKYLTQRFLENTQYSAALSRNPRNRWIICSFVTKLLSLFSMFFQISKKC